MLACWGAPLLPALHQPGGGGEGGGRRSWFQLLHLLRGLPAALPSEDDKGDPALPALLRAIQRYRSYHLRGLSLDSQATIFLFYYKF
jgi:hypothetical protein